MRPSLHYWQKESASSSAEVDYVISFERDIIPIEVKGGKGSTLKSMHLFLEQKKSATGWRFSTQNFSVYQNIHSFPLYAVASAVNDKSHSIYIE